MHALNNAVGLDLHSPADLMHACSTFLEESGLDNLREDGEDRSMHEAAGGWYSIEVLAKAVTTTRLRKYGRVAQTISLAPLHTNPSALKVSLGAVVNVADRYHWVALRWLDNSVWLLDSLAPSPVMLSWQDYVDFVRTDVAYRIEEAFDMALLATLP